MEIREPQTSEESFLLLELDSTPGRAMSARDSDVAVDAGPVAHAIDPAGRRHLLVPLDQDQPALNDTSSRGVSIRTHPLIDKQREQRYLDMTCLLPELQDLFALLCDEMLARLRENPQNPASICRMVLNRWRELLEPFGGTLLGNNALAGLVAELHFMEHLAAKEPTHALALWTGPYQSRFDFTAENAAAEVKATTLRERLEVEIHGIAQLDPPPGIELCLYVERLESVPEGGDSVPDVIERLRQTGCDIVILSRSLHEYGYSISDSEVYENVRFRLLDSRWYLVDDPLPRMIKSSFVAPEMLDRIAKVRYSIDLTSSPPDPMGSDAVERFIRNLTRGAATHGSASSL
jgi:hypothetical protein